MSLLDLLAFQGRELLEAAVGAATEEEDVPSARGHRSPRHAARRPVPRSLELLFEIHSIESF